MLALAAAAVGCGFVEVGGSMSWGGTEPATGPRRVVGDTPVGMSSRVVVAGGSVSIAGARQVWTRWLP